MCLVGPAAICAKPPECRPVYQVRRRISHADLHINLKLLLFFLPPSVTPPTRFVEGGSTHCQISCLLSTGQKMYSGDWFHFCSVRFRTACEGAQKINLAPSSSAGRKGCQIIRKHPLFCVASSSLGTRVGAAVAINFFSPLK